MVAFRKNPSCVFCFFSPIYHTKKGAIYFLEGKGEKKLRCPYNLPLAFNSKSSSTQRGTRRDWNVTFQPLRKKGCRFVKGVIGSNYSSQILCFRKHVTKHYCIYRDHYMILTQTSYTITRGIPSKLHTCASSHQV